MNRKIVCRFIGAVLLLVVAPTAVPADGVYPSHPIRMIVPVPPGSAADLVTRIVAEKIAIRWGQPVIVENRPGGGLNIGAEVVARSEPDGYTLLATPAPPLAINQSLYPKLEFDPAAFVPVTVMAAAPNVLVVNPKMPFSTIQDLVTYAKAHPDKLTYASAGVGSTSHLAMELLKNLASIQIVHVPYKGLVPTDLVAGQVDMMFNILGNTLPLIRDGKLKVLAVGSDKRLPELPDIPTVSETFPGFLFTTWFAIVAPPKTSPEIAVKLSAAIAEALALPDVARRVADLELTIVGSTPTATATFIREERTRWHQVIVSAAIKPE